MAKQNIVTPMTVSPVLPSKGNDGFPLDSRDVSQSGCDQHQCRAAISERTDNSSPSPDLAHDAFLWVIRPQTYPVGLRVSVVGIRISMDGNGRWVDNVFVERLWRSLKYEEVYLKAYETVTQARQGMGNYFQFYNRERRHQSLDRRHWIRSMKVV